MLRIILIVFTLLFSTTSSASNTVQKLYQSVNNSVVELHVEAIADPAPGQVNYAPTKKQTLGSGALISQSGRILTAAHVVDRATNIKVLFADGSSTSGHVVWVDSLIDLAMIQTGKAPTHIKPLPLAKPSGYQIGDQVAVIGAPYGVSHSLSVGYVSGVRDQAKIPGTNITPRLIQTDAAINQGNSGGPMFNHKGEIIGIVSYILSRTGGSNGLGFVVSVDTIHDVMNNDPGTFSGFIPHLLTPHEAKALNNPYGYGMLIQQVIPKTIADKLGFRGGYLNVMVGRKSILLGGDIVLSIADSPLKNLEAVLLLKQRLNELEKGDTIDIKFLREGKIKTVVWEID